MYYSEGNENVKIKRTLMRIQRKNKGFTLLEILLVIAAIGILAAIVLIAINPNKQIEAAREAKRKSDQNAIAKAIQQYIIEKGVYPPKLQEVGVGGTVGLCVVAGCSNGIDLSSALSDYISSIPIPDRGQYLVTKTANGVSTGYDNSNIWATASGGTTVSPSLDLNFARDKSLIDSVSGNNSITFTRNSIGTYVGSDGLIKTAGINEPRFDHNPVTGESLGLLVEEERSNFALISQRHDFNWVLQVSGGAGEFIDGETITTSTTGATGIYVVSLSNSTYFVAKGISGFPAGIITGSISGATRNITSFYYNNPSNLTTTDPNITNEVLSPDGTYNATLVVPKANGSQLRTIGKRYTTSTARTYTFSIFFKNKNISNNLVAIYLGNQTSLSNVVANFNLSTKTFSTVGQNGGWTGSVGYQDYPNGWMRIWVTATTTANSHTFLDGSFWLGGYQGTNENIGSLYVWESQLEQGSFPTSQISTTTTSSTRDREVSIVDGSNFTDFYNPLEGSIYTKYNIKGSFGIDGFNRVFEISNGTPNNRFTLLSLGVNDDVYEGWQINGFNDINFNTINTTHNRFYKWIAGYKENDFQRYSIDANGNLDSNTDISIGLSSFIPNQFNIGYEVSSNIRQLNGHIDRLTYWPTRLSNATLQSITQ